MKRKVLIALLVILVIIQFIRPKKNQGTVVPSRTLAAQVTVPDHIKTLLEKSCNDCHTNHTVYPWYSEVQPVGWWLQNHVNDGKKHLNLDEFASYDSERRKRKLKEIAETVGEGEMPLSSYLIIHKDARLSESQKKELIDWARQASTELK